MKRIAFLVAALTLAAHPLGVHGQTPAASVSSVTGTFDRGSIVIAFYRSPLWDAIIAERRYEMKTAKAANDTAKVKLLDTWGAESQELAMQQLAGQAPIDNIVAVLQTEFRELKSRMKLSTIVESTGSDPKPGSVDVTPQLLDWLQATPETRKMAADMRAQHPAGK